MTDCFRPRLQGFRAIVFGPCALCVVLAGTSCSQAQRLLPDSVPEKWKNLSAKDLRVAAQLRADFDASLLRNYKGQLWQTYLIQRSRMGNSMEYYYLQLGLDPLITMFETTGHEPYLQLALELCENMVAAADQDRDGDGHPEWDGSRDGKPTGDRPDILLQDFQGSCPIIRLARVILTDADLERQFGPRARSLAQFVDQHILKKWLIDRKTLVYWRPPKRWLDKMAMLVRMELDLYAITGKKGHLELAEEFALLCKEKYTDIDPRDDAIFWRTPGWDTSHTNRNVTMVIQCKREDLVYTHEDVERVVNTFLTKVWNRSETAPAFHNFHNGENRPYRNRGPFGWGETYDGWIKLGLYDSRVQEIGMTLWEQVKTGQRQNPGVKPHSSPYARMAMPANLLDNLVHRQN